ncbi:MAG TPA: hypothetical protein VN667_20460 [Burkholderiales bacterium]|nr:hypothetical protein [Burkholderiales bacterium]
MEQSLRRSFDDRWERRFGSRLCNFDMGGGDTPQVDPAVGQAAQANAEIGKEALDFSKQQYEDSKPRQAAMDELVSKVMNQQYDLSQKSADQADDYYNYMKTTFRPMEQSLADEANAFDTDAKRNELATKAGADAEQAARAADASAVRDMARYGVNPTDGAFADNSASSALNLAAAKTGAMNQARTQARAEGRAFKFDVAGLGRGLSSAGATSTGLAINAGNAAVANSGAADANARADANTMMAGFGTATAANQSAGNLYGNIFNGQMQGYNAQQQAAAGTAQGVGTAVGMAAIAI